MPIDLAVGAPTAFLDELCPLGRAELCFVHLLLGGNPGYRSYYEKARADNKFTILDNGVMERGFAATMDELLSVTAELRPHLVTPPEVLHDTAATLALTHAFVDEFARSRSAGGSKILGVAHGRSLEEWCGCFEELLKISLIARIGIPYDIQFDVESSTSKYGNHLQRLVTRRRELCNWISMTHPTTAVHLFGLAHPSELAAQARHPFIRSIDTSLPMMAAVRRIRYESCDYGPFEKDPLDISLAYNSDVAALARHNVTVLTSSWLTNLEEQQ